MNEKFETGHHDYRENQRMENFRTVCEKQIEYYDEIISETKENVFESYEIPSEQYQSILMGANEGGIKKQNVFITVLKEFGRAFHPKSVTEAVKDGLSIESEVAIPSPEGKLSLRSGAETCKENFKSVMQYFANRDMMISSDRWDVVKKMIVKNGMGGNRPGGLFNLIEYIEADDRSPRANTEEWLETKDAREFVTDLYKQYEIMKQQVCSVGTAEVDVLLVDKHNINLKSLILGQFNENDFRSKEKASLSINSLDVLPVIKKMSGLMFSLTKRLATEESYLDEHDEEIIQTELQRLGFCYGNVIINKEWVVGPDQCGLYVPDNFEEKLYRFIKTRGQ